MKCRTSMDTKQAIINYYLNPQKKSPTGKIKKSTLNKITKVINAIKGEPMKINKDKFYAIIQKNSNGTVTFFNNRIYSGCYVMSAYTQIPNKKHYQIVFIHYNPLKEVTNEN